jgi:hypothetical protein
MLPPSLLASGFAVAADDSKVKAGTRQVERGTKKIPAGKVGESVKDTGKRGRQDGDRRSEVQREKGEGGCEVTGTPMLATPTRNTTSISRSRNTSRILAAEIARLVREDMT